MPKPAGYAQRSQLASKASVQQVSSRDQEYLRILRFAYELVHQDIQAKLHVSDGARDLSWIQCIALSAVWSMAIESASTMQGGYCRTMATCLLTT